MLSCITEKFMPNNVKEALIYHKKGAHSYKEAPKFIAMVTMYNNRKTIKLVDTAYYIGYQLIIPHKYSRLLMLPTISDIPLL